MKERTEYWSNVFKKRKKETSKQIQKSTRAMSGCSRTNTVEVLYVQNSVILASMLLTINRNGSL